MFRLDGNIYRAFYPEMSSFYADLFSGARMKGFISRGAVIETDIETAVEVEGFGLVVRHRRIEHPSFCFEWPANMLKDAALLTLDLARDICPDGLVLQDASPFNVLFDGARPVFVDVGSFTRATNAYLWAAYQQFCTFFLFPLYLYAAGNDTVPKALLMDCYNGVRATDVAKCLGFPRKLRTPGYWGRVWLPERLAGASERLRKRKDMDSLYARLGDRVDIPALRSRFLAKLHKNVTKIRLPGPAGNWADYYEETDAGVLESKKREIGNALSRLNPDSVLDIGCNRGVFSLMAAEAGADVIALDSDHGCATRLYEIARDKRLRILPLVFDVLNPSPGIGWRAVQYPPARERLRCDMVFALALLHHLVFTGGQDFDRVVQSIKDFQKKWCIIEYIDPSDPMTQFLPRRPTLDYGWYTFDNFLDALQRNYTTVTVLKKLSDTRTLLLAEI
jgi:SAM-dependent methyltransferase